MKSCHHPSIATSLSLAARKGTVRKREKEEGAEDENPDDVKGEAKDEDGESDAEGKTPNTMEGEEADVRDVIYNLENHGKTMQNQVCNFVHCPTSSFLIHSI